MDPSIETTNTSSARVELGHSKVWCQVQCPIPSSSPLLPQSTILDAEQGTLICQVKYANWHSQKIAMDMLQSEAGVSTTLESTQPSKTTSAFVPQPSSGRIHSTMMRQEADLSTKISSALRPILPLHHFAKCAIVIQLVILQDDGSLLSACLTAASLALAKARVELYDLVTCCAVAVHTIPSQPSSLATDFVLLADPTSHEEATCDCLIVLAVLPNSKEVSLWNQRGSLPSTAVTNSAMELCRDGCRTLHRFMRQHLIETNN